MSTITIKTKDGGCPAYVYRPAGAGPWPAVLMYMDGVGIRPAMLELGERLATYGYFVLLPDLYYRSGPYELMGFDIFTDPEKRAPFQQVPASHTTSANIIMDTRAFIGYLRRTSNRARSERRGYRLGGYMRLRRPEAIRTVSAPQRRITADALQQTRRTARICSPRR